MTLPELIVSMAILAIGLVGVASIFPAAGARQSDAVNEILAEQAARNAEAWMKTFRSDPATLTGSFGSENVTYDDPEEITGVWATGSYPMAPLPAEFTWHALARNVDFRSSVDSNGDGPSRVEGQLYVFVVKNLPATDTTPAPTTTNTYNGRGGDLALFGYLPSGYSTTGSTATLGLEFSTNTTPANNPLYRSIPVLTTATSGGSFSLSQSIRVVQPTSASTAGLTYRVYMLGGDVLY
jgi:prepilin-type N-terminal cleavage/methylation domain-containing protein